MSDITTTTALKRITFTFEALCSADMDSETLSELDLADVLRECHNGDMSGRSRGHRVEDLDLKQARAACAEHGTDPDFFQLPAYEVGERVWWSDPDDGVGSGWYQIVSWRGGHYEMVNDAGGECEALDHELSGTKP
jgi:hypothetical protein